MKEKEKSKEQLLNELVKLQEQVIELERAAIQHRKLKELLKESKDSYHSIIESIPLGMHMYRLEEDGRLIFTGANPTADTILGVDNTRFVGKTLEEAEQITRGQVAEALDGLPPVKLHCSNLAADGLHEAIKKYREKQK